jgi:acyl carrier protein phosphodiesterase
VLDIFYDHFLAKNFSEYSDVSLPVFAAEVYSVFMSSEEKLPDSVKSFLPFMISRNWLVNYATTAGIDRTLKGLSKRVAFQNNMDKSIDDLNLYYTEFESDFNQFFPLLITFAAGNAT